mmetsp:Transcript_25314/g.60969  ORF Transcript_25314/g.60969 Transcript_25314/m.60969 type:complete len:641 (+) Transcript_25314:285-2207(+)|eukprot:CAMPEP_0114491480 /NCGR_PEP_ID=MMETSP0109-20121206/3024_1 /TAXON_ID=29199 /ORGANISM="Chlorarachnion reptans, Strain CCCM449" /LENGTH=640 /DNA_ID=CAMNT_0001668219 /DNA_START=232 /DNA_END=2154 /DNA_ORIENTATION=+
MSKPTKPKSLPPRELVTATDEDLAEIIDGKVLPSPDAANILMSLKFPGGDGKKSKEAVLAEFKAKLAAQRRIRAMSPRARRLSNAVPSDGIRDPMTESVESVEQLQSALLAEVAPLQTTTTLTSKVDQAPVEPSAPASYEFPMFSNSTGAPVPSAAQNQHKYNSMHTSEGEREFNKKLQERWRQGQPAVSGVNCPATSPTEKSYKNRRILMLSRSPERLMSNHRLSLPTSPQRPNSAPGGDQIRAMDLNSFMEYNQRRSKPQQMSSVSQHQPPFNPAGVRVTPPSTISQPSSFNPALQVPPNMHQDSNGRQRAPLMHIDTQPQPKRQRTKGPREKKVQICQKCGKTFSTGGNLSRHMLTHSDERPFSCGLCFKSFRQRVHLKKHIRLHTGEKPYSCPHCSKSFTQKSTLTGHIRTKHTGETPYPCPDCDKRFPTRNHLRAHKNKCIPGGGAPKAQKPKKKSSKRNRPSTVSKAHPVQIGTPLLPMGNVGNIGAINTPAQHAVAVAAAQAAAGLTSPMLPHGQAAMLMNGMLQQQLSQTMAATMSQAVHGQGGSSMSMPPGYGYSQKPNPPGLPYAFNVPNIPVTNVARQLQGPLNPGARNVHPTFDMAAAGAMASNHAPYPSPAGIRGYPAQSISRDQKQ